MVILTILLSAGLPGDLSLPCVLLHLIAAAKLSALPWAQASGNGVEPFPGLGKVLVPIKIRPLLLLKFIICNDHRQRLLKCISYTFYIEHLTCHNSDIKPLPLLLLAL